MKYKIKKVIRENETYDSLFYTHCGHCGKRIIVDIPYEFRRYRNHGALSCSDCVPENSSVRNNMDESTFTDVSKKLWGE